MQRPENGTPVRAGPNPKICVMRPDRAFDSAPDGWITDFRYIYSRRIAISVPYPSGRLTTRAVPEAPQAR